MSRASSQSAGLSRSAALLNFGLFSSSKTKAAASSKICLRDLTFILRNLSTLLMNGLSLPRALGTLAEEEALAQYSEILNDLRRRVETGEPFSKALARYPNSFDTLVVSQIRVGEQSGTLGEALEHLADEQEHAGQLRSNIIKKLSYPLVLMGLGACVVTFMMFFVIPVFEKTYSDAGIPLPLITRLLIGAGAMFWSYGWIVLVLVAFIGFAIYKMRSYPEASYRIDRLLLRTPLLGPCLRDIAVLQLMDVLGQLMDSGFKLAEALGAVADSVGNRAVRKSVKSLQSAVNRGERFSRELENHRDLFPPVVSQLVIVGESTGRLAEATKDIRKHLRKEIERKTTIMVGVLEPVLTISLAAAIGFILLAIYLPMFDMIGTVSG